MSTEHVPNRPIWTCRDCGEPWPCLVRRGQLRREAVEDRVGVLQYLGVQYWFAMDDSFRNPVTGPSPRGMRGRFLGWIDQGPVEAAVCAVQPEAVAGDGA